VAAHGPIKTNATEISVRAPVSNRGAALTRHSACQLPLERLDIPLPVEPKPPREVDGALDVRDPDVLVVVVRDELDVLRNAVVGVMVEVRRPEE